MAHEAASGSGVSARTFPPEQDIPEFTPKAIILGVFFGILFGAATVYLALRAGLTVSASVPIAVLAIAVFKKLGKSTILENNIVQTIGSAGESVAAGVVFTVPALLFLAGRRGVLQVHHRSSILAIFGGILGVLFMIPLRRALIVKEHGKLPYPEGVGLRRRPDRGREGRQPREDGLRGRRRRRCSTSSSTGSSASGARRRPGSGPQEGRDLSGRDARRATSRPSTWAWATSSGPRIAGELFSGGVLSWLALIPLISIFVPETRVIADLEEPRASTTPGWRATPTRTGSTAPTSATSARAPWPAPAS